MSMTKQNVSLSLKDIIASVTETNASLLNYLIVLGKYFICMELSKAKQFSKILFTHFAH